MNETDMPLDEPEDGLPRGDKLPYRPCAGLDHARVVRLTFLRDALEYAAWRADFGPHDERARHERECARLQRRIEECRL